MFEVEYKGERWTTEGNTPFTVAEKATGCLMDKVEGYPIRGEWMKYTMVNGDTVHVRLMK